MANKFANISEVNKKRGIESISMKNFRRFKSFPKPKNEDESLVLNDITLLVGRNNAGKSTLAKALILIVENLTRPSKLPFSSNAFFSFRGTQYPLHIDTFERAINNQTGERFIQLKATINGFIFTIDIVEADDIQLYNHVQEEEDATAPVRRLHIKDGKRGVSLEILPYEQRFVLSFESLVPDSFIGDRDSALDNRIEELSEYIQNLESSLSQNLDSQTGSSLSLEQIVEQREKLIKAEVQLRNLKLERNKRAMPKEGSYDILSTMLQYKDSWETMLPIIQDLEAIIDYKAPTVKNVKNLFSRKDNNIFDALYSAISNHKTELREMADDLDRTLRSLLVEYLQAHLASQEIMLNPNDRNNVMARIIDQYVTYTQKSDKSFRIRSFILKWMEKDTGFDIGEDFKIIHYPGHNYVMTIRDFNGKEVNVSDMGMGTNQLLILLFQVANNAVYGNTPLLIIEEPEQNLHPQMQSRLAGFMKEVNEKFGIKFLVETHSEYLIRKTQVLVAQQKYKDEEDLRSNNPFAVYYFDEEKGVYPMEYGFKGMFLNDFGKGFMDESAKLAFTVLKASR